MCLRTGTGPLEGPEEWKGTRDLVQDNINMDIEEMEVSGTKNKYK